MSLSAAVGEKVKKTVKQWAIKRLSSEIGAMLQSAREESARKARQDGYGKGYQEGQESGRTEGHQKGYEDGYQAGLTAGSSVFTLVDERTPFRPKFMEDTLYGPSRFPVTEVSMERMRAEVRAAVDAKILAEPTVDQWRMIFADHPSTCVSAGAGSGKSTTLILRVVFMVQHMGIRLDQVTVVSFTKASCEELREKLARVLGHWQRKEIDPESLRPNVSTFHSLLIRLTRKAMPGRQFFEILDDRDEVSEEEIATIEVDNPLIATDLSEPQATLLDTAYRAAYRDDRRFRRLVFQLLAYSLEDRNPHSKKAASNYPARTIRSASDRDAQLSDTLSSSWAALGWPLPSDCGVENERIQAFSVNGYPFFADARIGEDGPLIVLACPKGAGEGLFGPPGKDQMTLGAVARVRQNIFSLYCESQYLVIKTPDDLRHVETLARRHAGTSKAADEENPPKFMFRLPGEKSGSPLPKAFLQQAGFISSMGRDVIGLLNELPAFSTFMPSEHDFATALGIFWGYFENTLNDAGVITFDRTFMQAASQIDTMHVDPSVLSRMRHLLVDEFQDISPLIVDWLTAAQRRLRKQAPNRPISIMAIGDDWQSIYSWRGSSPELFMNFGAYFRSDSKLGPSGQLEMGTNFRSTKEIVDDATLLTERIVEKTDKHCDSPHLGTDSDHGVRIIQYGKKPVKDGTDINEWLAKKLVPIIYEQYEYAVSVGGDPLERVIVMTRSNSTRRALKNALEKRIGLRLMTYHRAKGLQATVAIMVGDCSPGETHPFRNAVYESSGRFPIGVTYDNAQADEALRLAYVGVTRGKRRVLWAVENLQSSYSAEAYGSRGVTMQLP
ncbi:UvrD-helicase domain-containing protein [Dyella japonica]|uniref:Superfamily I DNA/RNA helicase n=1 Tax=Dyella japonica TaxID=231455 RepID=A0ABV2JPC6_9GAMM